MLKTSLIQYVIGIYNVRTLTLLLPLVERSAVAILFLVGSPVRPDVPPLSFFID